MSESKHTQGPWKARFTETDPDVLSSAGDFICAVYTDENADADARLIAAAPDLLGALKGLMLWVDNWSPAFIYDEEWRETEDLVKAAIAKAEGR